MIHAFEGPPLVVPADRPKQVAESIRVDGVTGKLLGARAFIDAAHSDPTDLRALLRTPFSSEPETLVNRSKHPNGGYTVARRAIDSGSADPNGDWQLLVQDLVAGDGGQVTWRLELETTDGEFYIELDLDPELKATSVYRAAFEQATLRWAELITGPLGARTLPNGRRVDNLLIFASAPKIDGRGSILGQASPTYIRHDTLLPIAGTMRFDADDLAWMADRGTLFDVIVHEMGHVLGIGTLWSLMGLITGSGTEDPRFTGEVATKEYAAWEASGASSDITGVPVENTGGGGTREAHWRESVLDTELMTGWIDAGFNPLSRITAGSLADQGYQVAMSAADRMGAGLKAFRAKTAPVRRCACTRAVPRKLAA